MNPHWLLVPLALPLLGSGAALHSRLTERGRNRLTLSVALLTSAFVLLLLLRGSRETVTLFSVVPGFDLAFRLDGMGTLMAAMLAFLWPPALLYAYAYMEGEQGQRSFFAFYLMSYSVALGVAFSDNLMTLYVFFEMLTLTTLPLVAQRQDAGSVYAGRLYMAYCVAGAGMAFLPVVLATLDGGGEFRYGGNLAERYDPVLLRVAFALGFFGFGTKAAIFPLHDWLPKASVAPTPVTALLHAVAVVNTGIFAVIRLSWYAFGPDILTGGGLREFLLCAAAFSMVFAAVKAVRQRQFKRRLAYSTMSNLSYMLYGVALLTPAGLLGSLAHMLFHGVIKMSLFLCAGAFLHVTGREYLYELHGAGRRMPFTFVCYTLGALSLTGIPLFCGFVSKWTLLQAGLALGSVPALLGVAALIAAAFLCAVYTLTVSVRAFFPAKGADPDPAAVCFPEADLRMLFPIGLFTLLNLLLGVCSGPVMALLERVAAGE